jgi:thioredoxin-like negative regulator of GroEL
MRAPLTLLPLLVFANFSSPSVAVAAPPPAGPAALAAPQSVLPFIEDDFAEARKQAQKSDRLLVVDAWAPWCHTCLSMRNLVFPDPLLRPLAQRFVYLAVDTELLRNADFVARFPISSWPTMLILDTRRPDGDKVVARFTGSMSAAELLARLDEVAKSAGRSPFSEAEAAVAAGNHAAAAVLYARLVENPALRPRARLGQIQALRKLGQHLACAELGDTAHAEVGRSSTAADFLMFATLCLEQVTDLDAQARLRKNIRQYLIELVRDPRATLLPDDRSDGYGSIIELSDGLGENAAGDRFAEERLQLLEAAAAQARTPTEAATYDAHRFDCYRRLKRYAPAEAMLTASEKNFASDYNPPARLARLYFEMGRLDEALPRIERAIKLAEGPRRIGMYELRANILHGLGKTREAIASLEAAIRIAQPSEKVAASLQNKVEAMRKHITALQNTLEPAAPRYEPLGPGRRGKAARVARRDP